MLAVSTIKESLNPASLIAGGYGEFIIYRAKGGDKPSPLDQKTYQLCYQVLIEAKQITLESEKREFLERNLTQIDPAIEIAFIPRTLYELCFIQKCLKESLRLEGICKNSKFERIEKPESKCWHGAYFQDFGDDQDEIIIDLAYRLNNSIVRNLRAHGPLSYAQITSMANEKLAFLNSCHEVSNSVIYNKLFEIIPADNTSYGITENMIDEYEGASCKPLGIKTEKMKEVVLNAIALECSSAARGKFILYRGSIVVNDRPLEYSERDLSSIHSLSYGTGLFAGCMYDPGATAFYYIRKEENDASAILIPQEEAATSPFAIPATHPLCQIFGRGEQFHARSRVPTKDVNPEMIIRCRGGPKLGKVGNVPSHFQLAINPQEFDEKFQHYMKKYVVNLKG